MNWTRVTNVLLWIVTVIGIGLALWVLGSLVTGCALPPSPLEESGYVVLDGAEQATYVSAGIGAGLAALWLLLLWTLRRR